MSKKERINEVDADEISGGASVYYTCPICGRTRYGYYDCLNNFDSTQMIVCPDCLKSQLDEHSENIEQTDIKKKKK